MDSSGYVLPAVGGDVVADQSNPARTSDDSSISVSSSIGIALAVSTSQSAFDHTAVRLDGRSCSKI